MYAIKLLPKLNLTNDVLMNSVFNERDYLAQLNHVQFVIKLHSTMQDDNYLYFLMEYAPNGSLRQIINNHLDQLFEIERKILIADILLGVRAMHKKCIAHRDIKPENIMLSSNNRIKICDFGEAKKFNVDAIIELVTQLKLAE